jgi:hypothetical protein
MDQLGRTVDRIAADPASFNAAVRASRKQDLAVALDHLESGERPAMAGSPIATSANASRRLPM